MNLGDRVENALDSALVDQHETEPHEELMAEVRKLDAVAEAVQAAAKRMRRGLSPQRAQFRCSHCGKNTPLLIDGILALADLENMK